MSHWSHPCFDRYCSHASLIFIFRAKEIANQFKLIHACVPVCVCAHWRAIIHTICAACVCAKRCCWSWNASIMCSLCHRHHPNSNPDGKLDEFDRYTIKLNEICCSFFSTSPKLPIIHIASIRCFCIVCALVVDRNAIAHNCCEIDCMSVHNRDGVFIVIRMSNQNHDSDELFDHPRVFYFLMTSWSLTNAMALSSANLNTLAITTCQLLSELCECNKVAQIMRNIIRSPFIIDNRYFEPLLHYISDCIDRRITAFVIDGMKNIEQNQAIDIYVGYACCQGYNILLRMYAIVYWWHKLVSMALPHSFTWYAYVGMQYMVS